MPKFRKKPVVIEAMQFTGNAEDTVDILSWVGKDIMYSSKDDCRYLEIVTLEGIMRADTGDWVIRGMKGEFYPCKPDIFAKTYEPVE